MGYGGSNIFAIIGFILPFSISLFSCLLFLFFLSFCFCEGSRHKGEQEIWYKKWPIPGKVNLFCDFMENQVLYWTTKVGLSHQLVTSHFFPKQNLRSFFCLCMSEHMIYTKNITNVTKTLHQLCHKRDQTKYCIKRNFNDRILCEVNKTVFEYVVHHLCIAQYKIP